MCLGLRPGKHIVKKTAPNAFSGYEPPQQFLNDLVSVLALPAMWVQRSPADIVGSFLDGLLRILCLDAAYVRLAAEDGLPLEFMRLSRDGGAEMQQAGDRFAALGTDPAEWPRQLPLGAGGAHFALELRCLGMHPAEV
jgi:hypothetical protein